MILLIINLNKKDHTPLALLQKRVKQNYADFKADMLMLDEEAVFEKAHRIAAVQDTFEQMTSDGMDYLEDCEIEFLLKFYNPLEMVANYLQERIAGYPVEIDEAFMELFNDDDHEENYLTVGDAEELMKKYGNDANIKIALLQETIEAGERYVKLLKLTNKSDADDIYDYGGLSTPFKLLDFDEDGFFIYGDDKEGCF